jgi:hypothetical protein
MFKNYSLNRLLALVVTVGFAFLTADTTIEHWSILKKDIPSFIPIIFSAIAFIIGVFTVVKWNKKWIRSFQIILLISFAVAIGGVYFHVAEDDDEAEEHGQVVQQKEGKDKPPLAPLSFGGLAVVGLLGTARKWHGEVEEKTV